MGNVVPFVPKTPAPLPPLAQMIADKMRELKEKK